MTEKEKKFLSDVTYSIQLIETFTKGKIIRSESTLNDFKNATQIISLRNRLIHSYDNVDDSIVWSIVTRHLGPLKEEINNKLG